MSRSVTLTFVAVGLFLILFPLALAKPGLPLTLKSDEPAYYLMALSIVHDGDLRCELDDIRRLALEFPYNTTKNLILGTDDGWRSVYFAKPYLVSLVAAPATALFGADGFVATNMALLLASVWLGALYLRQYNSDSLAMLFSAGFFLLSNAFAYVFWLHTEVLCIASVTAALFLGFTPGSGRPATTRWARLSSALRNPAARPFWAGAALVPAVYNKPYLALLGLPVVFVAFRARGARAALLWVGGAAAAGVVVCGLSFAWIGTPTPYLGLARFGVAVDSFDTMPELPALPESAPESQIVAPSARTAAPQPPDAVSTPESDSLVPPSAPAAPTTSTAADPCPPNSFCWIFRSFQLDANTLPNLGYFFVGRHTGLFPYAPFALLSLLLFLTLGPRSGERWLLLGCLAGIALYSLTFIWFNWHGGGGFIGNRYYVNALPGFLFLVTRIAPAWLPALGYALGGLFLGGIVFTPFGANVESPTLQAHTRNLPFQLLPFERTLSTQIPGYRGLPSVDGSYISGRADLFRPIGDALWIVGGQRVPLELRTVAPLVRPVFELSTFVAPNRVEIELGGVRAAVDFAAGATSADVRRVVLAEPAGERRLEPDGGEIVAYLLRVAAANQTWRTQTVTFRASKKVPRHRQALAEGVTLPDWEESELNALVGVAVSYLGEEAELTADVFSADWLELPLPATLPAGRIIALHCRLRNASSAVWRARGATSVQLAYHWLREDDTVASWEGLRTPLPDDVPPGGEVTVLLEVETPREPGRYRLALDPVRERIAWFSERRPDQVLKRSVEIVAANGR